MYDFPSLFYGKDFLNPVREELIDNCAEQCISVGRSCDDETIWELCNLIRDEKQLPAASDFYQATNNYCELRTEIISLLE